MTYTPTSIFSVDVLHILYLGMISVNGLSFYIIFGEMEEIIENREKPNLMQIYYLVYTYSDFAVHKNILY